MASADSDRSRLGRLTLGRAIRDRRQKQDLTITQFSELTGLSLSYLSDVERGRRLPALESLDNCADALKTTVTELMRGTYPWDVTRPPADVSPPPDARFR